MLVGPAALASRAVNKPRAHMLWGARLRATKMTNRRRPLARHPARVQPPPRSTGRAVTNRAQTTVRGRVMAKNAQQQAGEWCERGGTAGGSDEQVHRFARRQGLSARCAVTRRDWPASERVQMRSWGGGGRAV